ncbi:protein YgfX [Porticoccus sp. GXU_MW_L64]
MRQEFCLRDSQVLRWFVCLIHGFILLAVWWLPVSLWVSMSLSVALLVSVCLGLKRHHLLPQKLVIDETWSLQERSGRQLLMELLVPCYVTRWLTVLPALINGKRRYLVIPFDSLEADDYRRLGVAVRMH